MKFKYTLFFLLFLCTVSMSSQCAMCRAVLESQEDQSVAKGINDGIVYLMIIPYLVVATIAFIIAG